MSLSAKTKKWLKNNADISLKGKTVVVTGANSGVGFKTAETMLYLGAHVILACRNPQRAVDARKALAAEYPDSTVTVMLLDLADFSSIDAFVSAIQQQGIDIDVFVNNAGCFHQPGKKTKDGFDMVIGTNYLGTYYLTEKLMPYLLSLQHEVTYVNTVSIINKIARVGYKDFYFTKGKHRSIAKYGRSKICLTKYTSALAKKYEGSNVCVYMNHPGITLTPLGLNAVRKGIADFATALLTPFFNTNEKSSLSVAYILSHTLPAGSIVGPNKCFGGWGYPTVNRILKKVKTGAKELIAFTEKEITSQSAKSGFNR